jgi:hypothetical protein
MEWILQVADEIDDAVGALRMCSLGLAAEIGLLAAGALGVFAIGAAIATGAEVTLIFSAAIVLSVAATLKIHESQLRLAGYRPLRRTTAL